MEENIIFNRFFFFYIFYCPGGQKRNEYWFTDRNILFLLIDSYILTTYEIIYKT